MSKIHWPLILKKEYFILSLILVSAAFLRFYRIDAFGPNGDEKYTLLNVHGIAVGGYNQPELLTQPTFTPGEFWSPKSLEDHFQAIARADFGTHFSFNIILKGWIGLFGNSDFSVRSINVLINLLTILLAYFFTKMLTGSKRVALITAGFLAIDPLFVSQSNYARSYPLSFFLILLSTLLFYKLVNQQDKKGLVKVSLLYAFVASVAMINHYLNFVILLGHAIWSVLYVRDKKHWAGLLVAGALTLASTILWMTKGGGQWSLEFLQDKNALHLAMASLPPEQNPLSGIVDPSSMKNVLKKAFDIFLDSNVLSHNSFEAMKGIKIFLVVLSLSIVLAFLRIRQILKHGYLLIILGVLAISIHFFIGSPFLGISAFAIYFFVLSFHYFCISELKGKYKILILILAFLPLFYVIFDAFKSGHTTSLSQRYIGNAIPFLAIVVATGLSEVISGTLKEKFAIIGLVGIQLAYGGKELIAIKQDISQAYSFRASPRTKNPYKLIANKIENIYAKGDTVVFPSYSGSVYENQVESESLKQKNASDAQYVNIYFDKDATYVQTIDINEQNKVFLKKASGEKVLIFDLEDDKYRF